MLRYMILGGVKYILNRTKLPWERLMLMKEQVGLLLNYIRKKDAIVVLLFGMLGFVLLGGVANAENKVENSQSGYATTLQKIMMYDAPNGGNTLSTQSSIGSSSKGAAGDMATPDEVADKDKKDDSESRTADDEAKKNLDKAKYKGLNESKLTTTPLAKSGITNLTSEMIYNANPSEGSGDFKVSIPGNKAFAVWLGSMSHYGYLKSSMGGYNEMVGKQRGSFKIAAPWGLISAANSFQKGIGELLGALNPATILFGKGGNLTHKDSKISQSVDTFLNAIAQTDSMKNTLRTLARGLLVVVVSVGLMVVMYRLGVQQDTLGAGKGMVNVVMKAVMMIFALQFGAMITNIANVVIQQNPVSNVSTASQYLFDAESSAKGANFNSGTFPSQYTKVSSGEYFDKRYGSNSTSVISQMNHTAWDSLGKKDAEKSLMERYVSQSTFKADNYLDVLTSVTPDRALKQANIAVNQEDSEELKNGDKNRIKKELSERIAGSSLSDDNTIDKAGNFYQANYYNMVMNGMGGSQNQLKELLVKDKAWKNRLYYTSTWGSNGTNQLSAPSTYYLLNMEIKGDKEAYTLYDSKLQASRQPTFQSVTLPANKEGEFASSLWSNAIVAFAVIGYMAFYGFKQTANSWKYLAKSWMGGSWLDMANFMISWLGLNITVALAGIVPGAVSLLAVAIQKALNVATNGFGDIPIVGGMVTATIPLLVTIILVVPVGVYKGAAHTGSMIASGGATMAHNASKYIKEHGSNEAGEEKK